MNPLRLLTLVVAAVFVAAGAAISLGYLVPPDVQPMLRVTIGVVLMLMGVYRGILGWTSRRAR